MDRAYGVTAVNNVYTLCSMHNVLVREETYASVLPDTELMYPGDHYSFRLGQSEDGDNAMRYPLSSFLYKRRPMEEPFV